ncbi:outer membrane protein [Helicobacter bizzozeronii]|uniref:outer membrane protein n=2 Tax=Helicobacter bizzozeronii TaxID=56877 RepID=UPI000CED8228|nr:outer membrane protein [Helicobacter bizzozeronii]
MTQPATSNRLASKSKSLVLFSSLALCSFIPLSAEKNGVFIEGGFQYSNLSGSRTYSAPAMNGFEAEGSVSKISGNLYGADLQFGYKQFLGKKKHFGLRYYGFFSGQGGPSSILLKTTDEHDQPITQTITQPTASLFYGVGIDALFNFYEKGNRTYGVFAGVMVGGSSWLLGKGKNDATGKCAWRTFDYATGKLSPCLTANQYFDELTKSDNKSPGNKSTFSPTFVDFVFNFGFRTNFTKHQGFEFGVRVPTINTPYYTNVYKAQNNGDQDSKTTVVFRRNVAIYANYVINF